MQQDLGVLEAALRLCQRVWREPGRTSKFLQSMHLQLSEQKMEAWKHSQYFFRQPLFLQLQPLLWRAAGPCASAAAPSSPPCSPHTSLMPETGTSHALQGRNATQLSR